AREERKGVTFITHAEQDQIEARKRPCLYYKVSAKSLLIFQRRLFRVRILALDARNARGLHQGLGKEGFVGHAEVAIRVIRRDVALIAEKEVHLFPGKPRAQAGIVRQKRIKAL